MPVRSNDPDALEGSTLHRFKVKPPGGGWAEICLLDESDDPGSSDRWYIRIIRGKRRPGFSRADHILGLVLKRTVVTVGQAVNIQAEHFATTGHQVDPIPLYGGRRE